jgi:amino-acid N-acetyltransferase
MRGNSVDPGRLATVDGQRRPSYVVRRARTADVAAHPRLVDAYSASRILLSKATVTLYEDVQEFWVADTPESGGVIGCGALHVMLGSLAEVRTLATDPRGTGRGAGNAVLAQLCRWPTSWEWRACSASRARSTSSPGAASRCSRARRSSPRGMRSCRVSYDEGVAEFLDLDRVKPNTLGDTRMLRTL